MERVILMGPAEIRSRLRVSRQRAHQVISRADFPPPYQVMPMGKVWDAAEVERWIQRRRSRLTPPD
jgi:prophage regulatory protein